MIPRGNSGASQRTSTRRPMAWRIVSLRGADGTVGGIRDLNFNTLKQSNGGQLHYKTCSTNHQNKQSLDVHCCCRFSEPWLAHNHSKVDTATHIIKKKTSSFGNILECRMKSIIAIAKRYEVNNNYC